MVLIFYISKPKCIIKLHIEEDILDNIDLYSVLEDFAARNAKIFKTTHTKELLFYLR